MTDPERIIITSENYGMSIADAAAALDQIERLRQERQREMISTNQYSWTGPRLTVTVAPSGEVLREPELHRRVESLACFCRAQGIQLELMDRPQPAAEIRDGSGHVLPACRQCELRWSMEVFGGHLLQGLAGADGDESELAVVYRSATVDEISGLIAEHSQQSIIR